jgi:hydrogenase maturation protease
MGSRLKETKMANQIEKPLGKRQRRPKILVAGLGNLLLRDDGVGVHAVREFQKLAPITYRPVDVGCAVFDALHLFEWAEKILLIDAMKAGGSPGTVYRVNSIDDLEGGELLASLHELSVVQALKMINQNHQPEVSIIGIEPQTIDYGLELTEHVEAALPLVLQTGQEIVRAWIKEHTTN